MIPKRKIIFLIFCSFCNTYKIASDEKFFKNSSQKSKTIFKLHFSTQFIEIEIIFSFQYGKF